MPLLNDKDREFLREHLEYALEKPVQLLLFTQPAACPFCRETEQVLQELAALSGKISLRTYDLVGDREMAAQYGVDKIPATIVMGDRDLGVRFYGIPSGFEFTTLVEDIIDISRGQSSLSAESLAKIAMIDRPVHIQVFATPTCPFCPTVVRMAHSLAMASDSIRADMIETIEFPHLANRYGVQGVPLAIFNETIRQATVAPEGVFVARALQAAGLMNEAAVDALMASLSPAHDSG